MLHVARDEADLDVLLRDWSLIKGDLQEIQRACSQGRLWTALHLCNLRRTGRFADDPERIPHEAIVHLAGQIGVHQPARLAVLPRQATDSAIRNRVREYLDFVSFSADAKARLTASLAELALDGLGSAELVERAEAFLLAARVVLPARATLERLVASLNRQALEALFTCIAGRFSASTRAAFDRLLGNAGDGALYRSTDGAGHWSRVALPAGVNGPNGLAIDPRDAARLYLAAWGRSTHEGAADGGIYLSTNGGTSDARFIKDICPVVEFGTTGSRAHAIDERVKVEDLVNLKNIYRKILERFF